MPDVNDWVTRVDAVEARLSAVAAPIKGLTGADPDTGEQWEAGQVWGHIAEFIPFWIEQAGDVIDQFEGTPVPYGRLRTDPIRTAAIEQGLHTPVDIYWQEVRSDLEDVRRFLHALPEDWSKAVGLHPKFGEVATEKIIEGSLIGHLEEHAAQLEDLANKP